MRSVLSVVKNRLTAFCSAKKTTKILLILLAGTFLIFGFLFLSSVVCSKNSSSFCSLLAVLSNNSAGQKTGQEPNNSGIFSRPGVIETEQGIWDGPKFTSSDGTSSENFIYNGNLVAVDLSKPSMTLTKNNVSAEIIIDTSTLRLYYAPHSDSANHENYPISSLDDLFLKLKDGDFVSYLPGKFIIVLY